MRGHHLLLLGTLALGGWFGFGERLGAHPPCGTPCASEQIQAPCPKVVIQMSPPEVVFRQAAPTVATAPRGCTSCQQVAQPMYYSQPQAAPYYVQPMAAPTMTYSVPYAVAPVQMQSFMPVQSFALQPAQVQSFALQPTQVQSFAVQPAQVQSFAMQSTPVQSFAVQPTPVQSFALPQAPLLTTGQATSFAATPQAADFRAAALVMNKLADTLASAQAAPQASAQGMSQDCCDRLTREVTSINQRISQLQNIILKLEPFLKEPPAK